MFRRADFEEDLSLDITEELFALVGEDRRNAFPGETLDLGIDVAVGVPEGVRQDRGKGALSAPHEARQVNEVLLVCLSNHQNEYTSPRERSMPSTLTRDAKRSGLRTTLVPR